MDVIFERVDERRYLIGILRNGKFDVGADVPLRVGVGSPYAGAPHDLVHFAIEEQLRMKLGIFGQVAAGGDLGFFMPRPEDRKTLRDRKRSKRLAIDGREDAARSERLAAYVGHDGHLSPKACDEFASPHEFARVEARLTELLDAWRNTQPGQRLVLTWPGACTPPSRSTGRATRGRCPA